MSGQMVGPLTLFHAVWGGFIVMNSKGATPTELTRIGLVGLVVLQ